MLVMDIMEPSACKVPTTSKKPLSTWSFLSSHDLSWLQWTVAAGPADRREQRRQPVYTYVLRGVGAQVAGLTLSGQLQLHIIPIVAHELANGAHLLA